jgi:hypothetical protein
MKWKCTKVFAEIDEEDNEEQDGAHHKERHPPQLT